MPVDCGGRVYTLETDMGAPAPSWLKLDDSGSPLKISIESTSAAEASLAPINVRLKVELAQYPANPATTHYEPFTAWVKGCSATYFVDQDWS